MATSEHPVIDDEVHKQDRNSNTSAMDVQQSISDKKSSAETPSEPKDAPSLDVTLPRNWPVKKKFYNVAVSSLLCLVVTFGTSVYTPAIPDVMKDFKVTETVATLPLTTYTLGLAFGPMISAPVSETLGRMVSEQATLQATQLCASCVSLLDFFGGAPLPVTAGTGADLFDGKSMAIIGTLIMYTPFLGPAIGPVVGAFVSQHSGWHWTQYTLAIVAAAAYIPVLGMSETYLKIIMARRENKKSDAATEQKQKPPAKTLLLGVLFITLLRPIKMLISEPIVSFFSVYVAFNFAVVFMFFGSIPYVFESVYGFNRGETGLVFLSVGLGCTISVPTCIILDKLIYQKRWIRANREGGQGAVAPEHRLWAAMLGGFGLPIGLFWFAWSSRSGVHWIVPTLALIPYAWGNMCIYITVAMYLIDTYEALTAASAIAANGLLRYMLGATFPLFTITMYRQLGIGWATSVLGFISLAMLPIPWIIYKWGKEIRKKSKFDTRKFE